MAKKSNKKGAAPAPKPVKISPVSKPRKKSEIFNIIADQTGLARKQVAHVFDALGKVISVDLAKPSPGKPKIFVVPGMMKISAVHKPATKATTRPNPFKPGEMMEVKPKPAKTVLKIRPLKGLKEMV
jgi:nucleoid DNA-binding protein